MSDNESLWESFIEGEPANLSTTSYLEMYDSDNTAYEAYMLGQYDIALEHYKKALVLSTELECYEMQVRNHAYLGDCYRLLHRLKEALFEFLLNLENSDLTDRYQFFSVLVQPSIALNMPISLKKIENLIQITRVVISRFGGKGEASLLAIEGEVLALRGSCQEGLNRYLESVYMTKYDWDSWDYYRRWLISACFENCFQQLSSIQMRELIIEYELCAPEVDNHKKLLFAALLFEREHMTQLAYEKQETYLQSCREITDYLALPLLGICEFCIRNLVITIDFARYLVELAHYRHSESEHIKYRISRAYGGYYSYLFFTYRDERALKLAKKHLLRAYGIGKKIDELLECSWREEEVSRMMEDLTL